MKKYTTYGLILGGMVIVTGAIIFSWQAYRSGYEQASSDLTPLIRPEDGPTKIIPEDKGGLRVPHQNRLVYNLIGPNTSAPKVENLLAEPEKALDNPSPIVAPTPIIQIAPMATAAQPAIAPTPTLEIEHDVAPSEHRDDFEDALNSTLSKIDDVSHKNTEAALEKITKEALKKPDPAPETTAPATKPKLIRMQLATAKNHNVAKVLAELRQKLGSALKGIPLNAVPIDLGDGKGTVHKIYAGPFEKSKIPALCQKLAAYGQGCVIPKK